MAARQTVRSGSAKQRLWMGSGGYPCGCRWPTPSPTRPKRDANADGDACTDTMQRLDGAHLPGALQRWGNVCCQRWYLRLCWRRVADIIQALPATICWRYDPVNDFWTPLRPSPDQHALSQAVYFKRKLYNMGGYHSDLSTGKRHDSHLRHRHRTLGLRERRCHRRWVTRPPCYGMELFTSREARWRRRDKHALRL